MVVADYHRIESAIRFVERHARTQPSLEQVARHVGLSPFHLQRLFRRWAGLSPKRFLQFLTAEHGKELLLASRSVLDTTFEVGLSSPGRLHDLFVSVEAMTPGEFKRAGEGIEIRYGFHDTPFGDCLLAMTDKGVCTLWFVDDRAAATDALRAQWNGAQIKEDPSATRAIVRRIFRDGETPPLLLRGTNFQIKVWRALLRLPEGTVTSYGDLARRMGRPTAARAVAGAVARNPIAYLIPCHRVLRTTGALGGYRWGPPRKRAMMMNDVRHRNPTTCATGSPQRA